MINFSKHLSQTTLTTFQGRAEAELLGRHCHRLYLYLDRRIFGPISWKHSPLLFNLSGLAEDF